MILCVVFCVLVVFVIAIAVTRHSEAKSFNGGICPICKEKLRHFDTDSQGGRGYICDNCGYTTWISYNVDNHYTK